MPTITPITSGYYGDEQLKRIKKYESFQKSLADENELQLAKDAANTRKLLEKKNSGYKTDYNKNELDLLKFKKEYQDRIEKQRGRAKEILQEQEAGVGLEAQIQAAKAGKSGKIAESALAKISQGIAESFGTQLTEARNNLNTFEQGLDKTLNELDISTLEQEQMITSLKKILSDEEVAPAIAAIAQSSIDKKSYMDMYNSYVAELQKAQADELVSKGEEIERYKNDVNYWTSLGNNTNAKRQYLIRSLGGVIDYKNVDKLVSSGMLSGDADEVFSFINRLKKLDEIEKEGLLASLAEADSAKDFYGITSKFFEDTGTLDTTNTGTKTDTETKTETKEKSAETIAAEAELAKAKRLSDAKIKDALVKKDVTGTVPKDRNTYKAFIKSISDNYKIPNLTKEQLDKKIAYQNAVTKKFGTIDNRSSGITEQGYYNARYALFKYLIDNNFLIRKK